MSSNANITSPLALSILVGAYVKALEGLRSFFRAFLLRGKIQVAKNHFLSVFIWLVAMAKQGLGMSPITFNLKVNEICMDMPTPFRNGIPRRMDERLEVKTP